jgi:hypothetical protein
MRTVRNWAALGTLSAVAVLGLAAPAGAATQTARVADATHAANPRPVVLNCENQAMVRPTTLVLACGDGNDGLEHMHWANWTSQVASGYGTEYQNTCEPNCAEGHYRDYPVVVALWGSASVKGHPGERRYTEATFIYPGARPPMYEIVKGKVVTTYPVTRTLSLWP